MRARPQSHLLRLVLIVLILGCAHSSGPAGVESEPAQNTLPPEPAWPSPHEILGEVFQLGLEVPHVRPLLVSRCERLQVHQYEGQMAEPFERQTQIDCHGLEVLGKPRKVELLFIDGPLGHAWILVDDIELSSVRETLTRSFGPVVHETELDAVFASGTVALRRSPPEILVASPDLICEITATRCTTAD